VAEAHDEVRALARRAHERGDLGAERGDLDGLVDERAAQVERGRLQGEALAAPPHLDPVLAIRARRSVSTSSGTSMRNGRMCPTVAHVEATSFARHLADIRRDGFTVVVK